MQKRIHLDLDNVVADFEAQFKRLTGRAWDSLATAERWALLEGRQAGFFLTMPAVDGAATFVRQVASLASEYGHAVRFLTAVPRLLTFPDAEAEKLRWVREVLQSDWEVAFGPYAMDKAKHCRPGDILIDDNILNIGQWQDAGGVGIWHQADLNLSLHILQYHLART